MPKIEPAVTTLWYSVANGTSYIDIAKDLSMMNRRLYRQGMVYAIQDVQVGLPTGMRTTDVVQVSFSTVPNTWSAHNAHQKGFRAFRNQVRQIEQGTGIRAGSWNDFKVYMDDSHEDGTTLTPVDGNGDAVLTGDWDYSALVFDDDGTEKDLKMHMIGSSNLADTNEESGIGLIQEYSISRSIIQGNDPDTPAAASDSIYAKLLGTDEMMDRMVDNVESANDNPPYDVDDHFGGADNGDHAHLSQIIGISSQQSVGRSPGFIAPCGLIKVYTNEIALDSVDPNNAISAIYASGTAPTLVVGITVAAGPYRGVMATPMGQ